MAKTDLPKWCWHNKLECVVEVINAGHFPDTATVRLPDDRTTEVYIADLETNHGTKH